MIKYLLNLPQKIHDQAITQAGIEDRSLASVYRRIIARYYQKRTKGKVNENGGDKI